MAGCFKIRMVARYMYAAIFLVTTVVAWIVRDYSGRTFDQLQYFKACDGVPECLASEGVLRVSLGCFVFFLIMFVSTVGASRTEGIRDSWHAGWWPLKLLLWLLLMVTPFFVPSDFVKLYGEAARFGAGFFLFVQVLSIINFLYWWNEKWLGRCFFLMAVVSVLSYGAATTGISFMYIWFAPRPTCSLNIFFITWTLVLIIATTLLSLHSKVNAGIMTSSLVALYIVFLCWSAIMSEPRSAECNTRPRQTGKGDLVTVLSFLLALFAIVFATFSTGADTNPFLPVSQPDLQSQGKHVPYGYGFFHFVFAVGSMYFAMLFVGWNLHETMHRWSIDVGWASVWVKITNEWLAAAVYTWSMLTGVRSWKNEAPAAPQLSH